MKRVTFTILAILLTAAIVGTTYYIKMGNYSEEDNLSIADAFNASGAKMVINEVYFFARASNKEFKDLASLSAVCEDILKDLEIENYSRNRTGTDILMKADYLGSTKDGVKVSAMASIVGNKSGEGDKYITIDATETVNGNALLLRNQIESAFVKHGLRPVVNSCITGTFDGNLQDSQLENICRKIFDDSDAQKVDSYRDKNAITISAFSPMIKDKLNIDGKKINLGLSIRYNEIENKTYLWVATPVVNTEY